MNRYQSCTFCPQLCRHVCPVAVATGREAATPAKMMSAVLLAQRGRIPPEDAARAAALCTGCGACREHCKYGIDVPAHLAEARTLFASPAQPVPLEPLRGSGELVAIQCDDRPWADALARALQREVACLVTPDHLGQPSLEHPARAAGWLSSLQAALAGRKAVSCSKPPGSTGWPSRISHSPAGRVQSTAATASGPSPGPPWTLRPAVVEATGRSSACTPR
jgi:ferredoxin